MDRRDFLKNTGAVAASVAAGAVAGASSADAAPPAAPAALDGITELRLAMSWPDNCAGPAESARRIAARITSASEGRYRFALVAVEHGADAVRRGEADFYFGSEHDNLALNPAFAYFAGLPGEHGLSPDHLRSWILMGGGEMLWDDIASEHGLKALLAGHTGPSAGLRSRDPVDSLAALNGKPVWVPGLGREVVRAIGAVPSTVPATDLSRAIAAGDVVGADAGGMVTSYALGLLTTAPLLLPCAIHPHGVALSLGCQRAHWDRMPRSDQGLFQAAVQLEYQTMLSEEMAHGQLFPKSDSVSASQAAALEIAHAIHRVSDAVVAHLAASDARTARINASYAAFRDVVNQEHYA